MLARPAWQNTPIIQVRADHSPSCRSVTDDLSPVLTWSLDCYFSFPSFDAWDVGEHPDEEKAAVDRTA